MGSGPFRVESWEPGVHIIAQAHQEWVLGPPKSATLDIRFITDANTILANLLAGELDISAQPWLPPSSASELKQAWAATGAGSVNVTESRMEHMDLRQYEVPNWQPALTDVRVRQALLTALDRVSLAELLNAGLAGSPADGFILPTDKIPVLAIVLNNSWMSGHATAASVSTQRYQVGHLTGDYCKIAEGLGCYSERIEQPAELVPAIQRAIKVTADGRPALLEVMSNVERASSVGERLQPRERE